MQNSDALFDIVEAAVKMHWGIEATSVDHAIKGIPKKSRNAVPVLIRVVCGANTPQELNTFQLRKADLEAQIQGECQEKFPDQRIGVSVFVGYGAYGETTPVEVLKPE